MTEKTTHTPGPWHALAERGSVVIVTPARGDTIRLIDDSPRLEADANARLIAAAPELYAALAALREATSALALAIVMGRPIAPLEPAVNAAHDAATAALAKADGRS